MTLALKPPKFIRYKFSHTPHYIISFYLKDGLLYELWKRVYKGKIIGLTVKIEIAPQSVLEEYNENGRQPL